MAPHASPAASPLRPERSSSLTEFSLESPLSSPDARRRVSRAAGALWDSLSPGLTARPSPATSSPPERENIPAGPGRAGGWSGDSAFEERSTHQLRESRGTR